MIKFLTLLGLISAISGQCADTCIPPGRCDAYGATPVFGMVNGNCRVFQNKCIYNNENCMRQNNCESLILKVTQSYCQAHCPTCNNVSAPTPVCAWFPKRELNGAISEEYKSFDNECELRLYSCSNARAYVSYRSGNCT